MTQEEMLRVMQAHSAGKRIEYRYKEQKEESDWEETQNPTWDFTSFDYRVKTWIVPWTFEDYLEHAEYWYKRSTTKQITTRIVSFYKSEVNNQFDRVRCSSGWDDFHPQQLSHYSEKANGEFKPCTKEIAL